jgi:uncharacterized protein (DUF1501 family)
MSKFTRRDFIKGGASALGAGMALPVINRQAEGSTIVQQLGQYEAGNGNILVVVELAGGIDGLSVIVPYAAYDTYASLRPTVGVPRDLLEAFPGTTTMRMCPELANGNRTGARSPERGLLEIANNGKLAVVQAVGYPTPNLSHFTSRDIWYSANVSASVTTSQRTGWLGRHAALYGDHQNALDTVSVGGAVNLTLYAEGAVSAGISNDGNGNPTGYSFNTDGSFTGDRNNQLAAARVMDAAAAPAPAYVDLWETAQIQAMDGSVNVTQAASTYTSSVVYPTNGFANGLKMIAKLATSTNPTLGTRVYYISTGGFDSHANQATYLSGGNILAQFQGDLPRLLGDVIAPSLKAFYDDIKAHGLENKVIVMVWSEFGRRVAQNGNGTDHGTANNVLLMGGRVRGGVYGVNGLDGSSASDPSLTNLSNGNLRYKVDFRQVYATLIQDWLTGDPAQVLGGTFSNLGFIA